VKLCDRYSAALPEVLSYQATNFQSDSGIELVIDLLKRYAPKNRMVKDADIKILRDIYFGKSHPGPMFDKMHNIMIKYSETYGAEKDQIELVHTALNNSGLLYHPQSNNLMMDEMNGIHLTFQQIRIQIPYFWHENFNYRSVIL
jgi:hypothetical protein